MPKRSTAGDGIPTAHVSAVTAKRAVGELSKIMVPYTNHPFVSVVWVGRERRLYPVDKDGNCTVPLHLRAGQWVKNDPVSDQKCSAPAASPIIETPARVVDVRPEEENEPPNPLERQREADPVGWAGGPSQEGGAITEPIPAPIGTDATTPAEPPGLPAIPATPPAPAPPQSVGQGIDIQETPRVASLAPRTEAKPSPEQQLRDGLSPEERLILDALPLKTRARLIQSALSPFGPKSVPFLKRELKMQGVEQETVSAKPVSTAEMIRQLPGRKDPRLAHEVAQRLVSELRDPDFWIGWDQMMLAVWHGSVSMRWVAFAYDKTIAKMKKTNLESPGSWMFRIIRQKTGIVGADLERLSRGG